MILKFSRRMAFAILSTVLLSTAVLADDVRCFEQFKSSICSLNESGEKLCGEQHAQNQPYIEKLGTVFELMPPISQKLMCSIDHLTIIEDPDAPRGEYFAHTASINIEKGVFEREDGIDVDVMISEAMYFSDSTTLDILVSANARFAERVLYAKEGELYIVMIHELGHHFEEVASLGFGFQCLYNRNSTPVFGSSIAQQVRLILDLDQKLVPISKAAEYYRWLDGSAYVSTYSFRSDGEDFAEAFTYYLTFEQTSAFVEISMFDEVLYDTRSTEFREGKAEKFATIEYLIDAYIADDDTVGLKMLTCDYLDELDIN